jgi:hypothetical protein
MSTKFFIQSSDPKLLEKVTKIAKEFVQKYICDDNMFIDALEKTYILYLSNMIYKFYL